MSSATRNAGCPCAALRYVIQTACEEHETLVDDDGFSVGHASCAQCKVNSEARRQLLALDRAREAEG